MRAKLSSASYAMMSVKPYVTINTFKMIYYSYFHTMTYGLLFWGNFPENITIFRLQKRIIRIMLSRRPRDSCRELFFKLEIVRNSEIYHINTRQQSNLNLPLVNVIKYQKGMYYQTIKLFNALPSYIKMNFDIPMKFKMILQ
jgi:hypothetical protein